MAATAGTLILVGKSGRTYSVDLYIPDATGTSLGLNPAGLAGTSSPTSYRVPEDCKIVDISIGTAPTAVGCTAYVNGAVLNGGTFRWANQLQTLANRVKINLYVAGGDFLSFTQF